MKKSISQKATSFPEILTGPQVMEYLQISRRTLQDWIKDKKLPHSRIGRKLMFRKSRIDQLIDDVEVYNDKAA